MGADYVTRDNFLCSVITAAKIRFGGIAAASFLPKVILYKSRCMYFEDKWNAIPQKFSLIFKWECVVFLVA